jgi:hypothetical protein
VVENLLKLGGSSTALSRRAFDYRIIAKRKGYENIRLADRTKQFEVRSLPSALPRRPCR